MKRTLKIKDESENYFLRKSLYSTHRPSIQPVDEKNVRRLCTVLDTMKQKKKKAGSKRNSVDIPEEEELHDVMKGKKISQKISAQQN